MEFDFLITGSSLFLYPFSVIRSIKGANNLSLINNVSSG